MTPTDLTTHHAFDFGLPIACGSIAVYSGDITMGDANGIMVISRSLANEIAVETVGMELFEDITLEPVTANLGAFELGKTKWDGIEDA